MTKKANTHKEKSERKQKIAVLDKELKEVNTYYKEMLRLFNQQEEGHRCVGRVFDKHGKLHFTSEFKDPYTANVARNKLITKLRVNYQITPKKGSKHVKAPRDSF